ncbi:MAG: hypothetical protein ABI454_09610, partial [Sphingomicrobium sp.]
MSEVRLQGTFASESIARGAVRVAGLDSGGGVCAETTVDRQREWRLSAPRQIASIVVQQTQTGIAARLFDATDAEVLRLPILQACRIEFASQPPGAHLWVDPISLDSFPDELLGALRLHPEGTIDLHLVDYACSEGDLILYLQPGRYRIGGGRLALRPSAETEGEAIHVCRIDDLESG